MANELRIYQNFLGGRIDTDMDSSETVLSSPGLAAMAEVTAASHMLVTLDPDGLNGAPEVVKVTAHVGGSATATVERGAEGSVPRSHPPGMSWNHGPLASDMLPRWTKVVDEAGDSLASWTSLAGTWTTETGPFFKQANTGAAYYGLRYNTPVHPGAGLAAEAEIRFPSAATTARRALLGPAGQGSISGISDPWGGISEDTDQVWIQRGDQTTLAVAASIDEDVWYKVRVTVVGSTVSVSLDGVEVHSGRIYAAAQLNDTRYFTLVNWTGEVHYRNIKVWRLDGPFG